MRVLLVDDNPLVLNAIVRVLERDFQIVAAGNAADALRYLRSQTFDAIVSDHDMPDVNGIELLERVRSKWPTIRRVLICRNSLCPPHESPTPSMFVATPY